MIETDRFEKVTVASADELYAWLTAHHGQHASIWLVTWKKAVPEKYITNDTVLDALIAFGWIDGIKRKIDDAQVMHLISPRRVQHWAQSYKDRAALLIAEGRMQPAGMAAIERSKAAGLWSAMADVDALIVPGDLAEALASRFPASANFNAFAASYRRNVLRWIKLAKTAPTRAARIMRTVETSARNEKLPQM